MCGCKGAGKDRAPPSCSSVTLRVEGGPDPVSSFESASVNSVCTWVETGMDTGRGNDTTVLPCAPTRGFPPPSVLLCPHTHQPISDAELSSMEATHPMWLLNLNGLKLNGIQNSTPRATSCISDSTQQSHVARVTWEEHQAEHSHRCRSLCPTTALSRDAVFVLLCPRSSEAAHGQQRDGH